MNAPAYINNAHKALSRNPDGLTLEELSGKLRAKALKVSQQIRELHDAGLIETTEDAGQPVYRLIAAPAAESAESGRDDSSLPTKTYSPAVLQAMISDLSSDSEGGETDAPAWATDPALQYLAPEDYEMPPADPALLAMANRELSHQLSHIATTCAEYLPDPSDITTVRAVEIMDMLINAQQGYIRVLEDRASVAASLFDHLKGSKLERDDLRDRLHQQIEQWQADTGRLTADLRASMESRSQAINEADRLRAELATERQAREALQEQSDAVDVKDAAVGYLVRVPKRAPILRRKPESARSAALSAVRSGAARAEVLAVVPVGTARRGAEWQSTEAGGCTKGEQQ